MEYILTKRQLRLIKEMEGNNYNNNLMVTPNPSDPNKNSPAKLSPDLQKANQNNTQKLPINIDTSNYTDQNLTSAQQDMTVELPNNSQGRTEAQKIVNRKGPDMPCNIVLKNGIDSRAIIEAKRKKKRLSEMKKCGITFNKKELDKFLNEL